MTESCWEVPFPCRAGTAQMFDLLTKICDGEATHADLDSADRSLRRCQEHQPLRSGHDRPNPVLSTLRYFKHEYLEHIDNKYCRAVSAPAPARPGQGRVTA